MAKSLRALTALVRPGFWPQRPHSPSVLVPGDLMPSSGLFRHQVHTKIKNFLNFIFKERAGKIFQRTQAQFPTWKLIAVREIHLWSPNAHSAQIYTGKNIHINI